MSIKEIFSAVTNVAIIVILFAITVLSSMVFMNV